MRILSLAIILLVSSNTLAKKTVYKSWTNFQSDYGYEFKYPDCWEIKINNPDQEGELKKIKNIFVTEIESCTTPRREEYTPNGIGFSYIDTVTSENAKKEISIQEKSSKYRLENKSWLLFKKMRIDGGGEAIMYIEQHDKWKKKIRWVMKLFCPTREIYIVGAGIQNPNKELLQKFERGDLAIPEPEKTVFESIRCIEPKSK